MGFCSGGKTTGGETEGQSNNRGPLNGTKNHYKSKHLKLPDLTNSNFSRLSSPNEGELTKVTPREGVKCKSCNYSL